MRKKEKKPVPPVSELKKELARERYKLRYRSVLKSTVGTLVVVAAIAVLIAMLVMPVLEIYGSSMSPTLREGQVVAAVRSPKYEQGDMVAFYIGNKLLVKRIIAGPGDLVEISEEGIVKVNGATLQEPYVRQPALGECDIAMPFRVPNGQYFLMGDHRETSIDSRNSAVGCIGEDQILGKLFFRVWPFEEIGALN